MSPARAGEHAAAGTTARIGVAIVAIGLIALTLLSLRQQRLQAMHELSAVRLRQHTHDMKLWEVRSSLSALLTPEQVGVLPVDGDAALSEPAAPASAGAADR